MMKLIGLIELKVLLIVVVGFWIMVSVVWGFEVFWGDFFDVVV